MKLIKLAFLFSLVFTLGACSQNGKSKNYDETVIVQITPTDLKQETLDDIQLIDVRTPMEVSDGTIQGAENMNCLDSDFMEKVATLDKNKPVYLYCKSGGRSARSAKQLADAGFTKVYDLQGGITAWKAEGNEVVVE